MKKNILIDMFITIMILSSVFAWIIMGIYLAPLIAETTSFFIMFFYSLGIISGGILIAYLGLKQLEKNVKYVKNQKANYKNKK